MGFALSMVAAAAALTPISAGQAQQLRAWDHGPYGRLVFDWEGPEPTVDLTNLGDRAVITSSRAIERDVDWILQYLGDYISDVEMRDGGRTVVLYLTGPMRIDRLAFNDRAAFDFRRDPSAQAATSGATQPAPAEAPPPTPPSTSGATGTDSTPATTADSTEPGAAPRPPMDETAGQQAVAAISQRPLPEPTLDIGALPRPDQRPAEEGDPAEPEVAPATADGASAGGDPVPVTVAPAPSSASDLPRLDEPIPVRAVERLGYSRLVFDLPRPIRYRASNEGDLVAVMFDAVGEADLSAVDPAALPEVSGVVQETLAEGLVVAFGIRPGVELRDFAYGQRVVIDLLAPERGYVGELEGPGAAAPDMGTPGASAGAPDAPGAPDSSQAPGADETASTSVAQALQQADGSASSTAGDGTPGAAMADGGSETGGDDPTSASDGEVEPGDDPGPVPEASPAPPVEQSVMARTATFDIGAPMALAAFVRGDALWLVFAGEGVTTGALAGQGELGFGPATVAEARGGVALQFVGMGDRRPEITRDGTSWTVSVPASPDAAFEALAIERQPEHAGGGRLLIPAAGAMGPVAFIDPAVGDILVAMPVGDAGQGVAEITRFVEFRLLPTAQGVVIRPAADDLRVRAVDDGIEVTAEGGLQLF